jgi:hypothetical protein
MSLCDQHSSGSSPSERRRMLGQFRPENYAEPLSKPAPIL